MNITPSLKEAILFLLGVAYVQCYTENYMKKDNSLLQPYQGSWDFYGSTLITPTYVRLTSTQQSQVGGIYNKVPLTIRDWEVHINFKVHGTDGILFGDGMAFWYLDRPLSPGPVFGSHDYFRGLAVFLDTYSNHNGPHNHDHPYVSTMVNNGSRHYDHDKDGTHTEIAGCTSHFRNKPHDTTVVIRYTMDTLTVLTDVDNKGQLEHCFTATDIRLPTGYYIGVSAATGELTDNHDIVSIRTYQLDVEHSSDDAKVDWRKIEPEAASYAAPRDHLEDNPAPGRWTGLKIFLVVILALIGVAVCVVVGFMISARQADRQKRFY